MTELKNYRLKSTDGRIILKEVQIAQGFWQRGIGLLGKKSVPTSWGLLIETSSIHMFFMRFSLDLLYIDRQGKVVKVVRGIGPWAMSFAPGANRVVECGAGELPEWVEAGQKIELKQGTM